MHRDECNTYQAAYYNYNNAWYIRLIYWLADISSKRKWWKIASWLSTKHFAMKYPQNDLEHWRPMHSAW